VPGDANRIAEAVPIPKNGGNLPISLQIWSELAISTCQRLAKYTKS
jgi:hypothetical protein